MAYREEVSDFTNEEITRLGEIMIEGRDSVTSDDFGKIGIGSSPEAHIWGFAASASRHARARCDDVKHLVEGARESWSGIEQRLGGSGALPRLTDTLVNRIMHAAAHVSEAWLGVDRYFHWAKARHQQAAAKFG